MPSIPLGASDRSSRRGVDASIRVLTPSAPPRRQLSNSAAFVQVLCSKMAPPDRLIEGPSRQGLRPQWVSEGSGSLWTARGPAGTARRRRMGRSFSGVPVALASQVQAPSRLTRNSGRDATCAGKSLEMLASQLLLSLEKCDDSCNNKYFKYTLAK